MVDLGGKRCVKNMLYVYIKEKIERKIFEKRFYVFIYEYLY